MNPKVIVDNLYTNKDSEWIMELRDEEYEPFIIQNWLTMNDKIRVQTRWLDKYVFCLPKKMYLSLAWSIIPKTNKPPFVKYIKRKEETDEWDFILNKIRKQFKLSDNDFVCVKQKLINAIEKNKIDWFCFYGVEKKHWKKHLLDFKQMKNVDKICEERKLGGLEKWGI